MGIVISVSQGKGGSTKTTTSVNLAGALRELGFSVKLLDWDIDKPDATRWMKKGSDIDWIELIDKDNLKLSIDESKNNYDVIIFDTPPNYAPNAFKAIMASDFVIIPTSLSYLDQENTKEAISVPMLAQKPFKILMSRIKKGTKEGKEIQNQIGTQEITFNEIITDRNVLAQCPGYGQWIGQYAKGSDSHLQFINLAKEVIRWTGLNKKERPLQMEAS